MTSTEFSTETAFDVMRKACELAGLRSNDAKLIRFGENALFHLVDADVVVRVARTLDYWDDVVNEVNVSRWLAEQDFPAADLVSDVSQPLAVDDRPVTFWRFIHGRTGEPRDIATLGEVLRELHSLPRPTTFALPDEDILGRVSSRIAMAPIPDNDKEFLSQRFYALANQVADLRFPLAPAPTHGDAQNENIMIVDHHAVLIDFERFAWGQPEWDLSMTATEYLSAGWWTPDQYRAFCDAYGYDVTTFDGFDVLQAVHELKMTTWLMQNVNESADIAEEYQTRMRTIRGEDHPQWKPF